MPPLVNVTAVFLRSRLEARVGRRYDELLRRGGLLRRNLPRTDAPERGIHQPLQVVPIRGRLPRLPVVGQVGAAQKQPLPGAGDSLVEQSDLFTAQAGLQGQSPLPQERPITLPQQVVLPLGGGELPLGEAQENDGAEGEPPGVEHRRGEDAACLGEREGISSRLDRAAQFIEEAGKSISPFPGREGGRGVK